MTTIEIVRMIIKEKYAQYGACTCSKCITFKADEKDNKLIVELNTENPYLDKFWDFLDEIKKEIEGCGYKYKEIKYFYDFAFITFEKNS